MTTIEAFSAADSKGLDGQCEPLPFELFEASAGGTTDDPASRAADGQSFIGTPSEPLRALHGLPVGRLGRFRIRDLKRHPDFQPRPATQWGDLEPLKEAYRLGAKVPPIVVAELDVRSNRPFYVVDGHRRIVAAQEAGLEEINVELHRLTWSEAAYWACKLNVNHPKALKTKARNKAVQRMLGIYIAKRNHLVWDKELDQFEAKSIAQITMELGAPVTERTFRNWLKRLHRRVYEKYWADPNEFRGEDVGGSRAREETPHQDTFTDPVATIQDSLDHFKAALAVADEGQLLSLDKSLARELRDALNEYCERELPF